jgi:hypothetical protein
MSDPQAGSRIYFLLVLVFSSHQQTHRRIIHHCNTNTGARGIKTALKMQRSKASNAAASTYSRAEWVGCDVFPWP